MQNNVSISYESIIELANSFRQSRVFLTAIELDLFSALDGHLRTSAEVAGSINTDHRATDRLMNALCALGILRKTKDKFYNSDEASRYLVKGKPEYAGNLNHTAHLWKSWNTLTEAVQKGTRVYKRENKKNEDDWRESFIAAMHHRAKKQAEIVPLMLDLTNVNNMLDVGGGSGVFSMGFINAKKEIKATIVDLPDVLPITEKYVKEAGLEDSIKTIPGDYMSVAFGSGYDLVYLSAVIHINSHEENESLIKKCADSLNQNGQVVVQDFIMDEKRINPPYGAIFALNMLVNTERGDTYTGGEVSEWMKKAGLKSIEKKETGFGTSLVIGYK